MEQQPGKASYSITYRTSVDVVVFGCDFYKDVLVRLHYQPDNHGRGQTWSGYILDRLRTGAARRATGRHVEHLLTPGGAYARGCR